ncbi:MAG: carboxypeptidase regulatory-like domain-containing protein [bacterium]|nr:carboxypeptidase regulatory-like domain-containing protein [bacterium]
MIRTNSRALAAVGVALVAVAALVGRWTSERPVSAEERGAMLEDAPLEPDRPLRPESGLAADTQSEREATQRAMLVVHVVETASSPGGPHARPVAGLGVHAGPARAPHAVPLAPATTDVYGNATCEVEPGAPLWVFVQGAADSDGREVAPLTPGERRTIEVALEAETARDFFGRVVDRVTGRPVVMARVRFSSSASGESTSHTDADGRFRIREALLRGAICRVDAPGYVELRLDVHPEQGTEPSPFVAHLAEIARLRATVTSRSGAPVAGARVTVRPASKADGTPEWSAVSASDGACVFDALPPDIPLYVECAAVTRAEPVVLFPGEEHRTTLVRSGDR